MDVRTIDYDLRPEDLPGMVAAVHRPGPGARHRGRHERLRLTLAGAVIGGLVFLVVKQVGLRMLEIDRPAWVHGLAVLGAGAVVGRKLGGPPALPAADDPRLGRRRLAIAPADLTTAGEDFRSEIAWPAVTAIESRGDHLLFTTRWGDAHAVPLRAFGDASAARAFHDTAAAHRARATR